MTGVFSQLSLAQKPRKCPFHPRGLVFAAPPSNLQPFPKSLANGFLDRHIAVCAPLNYGKR